MTALATLIWREGVGVIAGVITGDEGGGLLSEAWWPRASGEGEAVGRDAYARARGWLPVPPPVVPPAGRAAFSKKAWTVGEMLLGAVGGAVEGLGGGELVPVLRKREALEARAGEARAFVPFVALNSSCVRLARRCPLPFLAAPQSPVASARAAGWLQDVFTCVYVWLRVSTHTCELLLLEAYPGLPVHEDVLARQSERPPRLDHLVNRLPKKGPPSSARPRRPQVP